MGDRVTAHRGDHEPWLSDRQLAIGEAHLDNDREQSWRLEDLWTVEPDRFFLGKGATLDRVSIENEVR